MVVEYTGHARREMANQGITEDEVDVVLGTYFERHFDKKGNRRLTDVVGGRYLTVVVARGSRPPRVITAWSEGRVE